jgi:putative membrane protein
MRSAIALMGFGVVIVRLRYFQIPEVPHPGSGWKLGLLFSLVGFITVLLSTVYYFIIRRTIDDDSYEPSTRRVVFFSITITLLAAWVIYYVFRVTMSSGAVVLTD